MYIVILRLKMIKSWMIHPYRMINNDIYMDAPIIRISEIG